MHCKTIKNLGALPAKMKRIKISYFFARNTLSWFWVVPPDWNQKILLFSIQLFMFLVLPWLRYLTWECWSRNEGVLHRRIYTSFNKLRSMYSPGYFVTLFGNVAQKMKVYCIGGFTRGGWAPPPQTLRKKTLAPHPQLCNFYSMYFNNLDYV